MKKIINGKMYNTETANEVGMWENHYDCGDFSYAAERLYRKRNGEFFLYGEGGAMSKYSKCYGGSMCYGEHIIPMTDCEAREWCEDHIDADEYIEIFGEVAE